MRLTSTDRAPNHQARRIAAVVDTFPTRSETFLHEMLANLERAGCRVTILARRKGDAALTPPGMGCVRYLPSEAKPLLWRVLVAAFFFVRLAVRSPREALRACRVLRSAGGSPKAFLREAHKILPLLLCPADSMYFSFGGLAAKYSPYFHLRGNGFVSLRGSDVRIAPFEDEAYRARLRRALQRAAGVHCVCPRSESSPCAGTVQALPPRTRCRE